MIDWKLFASSAVFLAFADACSDDENVGPAQSPFVATDGGDAASGASSGAGAHTGGARSSGGAGGRGNGGSNGGGSGLGTGGAGAPSSGGAVSAGGRPGNGGSLSTGGSGMGGAAGTTSSGGASSGGSGGAAQCDTTVPDTCAKCTYTFCCAEVTACTGRCAGPGGEFACMHTCLVSGFNGSGGSTAAADCADACKGAGAVLASSTQALYNCLTKPATDGGAELCSSYCFGGEPQ